MKSINIGLCLIFISIIGLSCKENEDQDHSIEPIVQKNFIDSDTLIRTNNGEMKISDLKVGDLVLTPNGFRKIIELSSSNIKLSKYIVRHRVLSLGKEIWLSENTEICRADGKSRGTHIEALEWVYVGSLDERAIVLIFSDKNKGKKEKIGAQLELPFYCSLGLLNITNVCESRKAIYIKLEDDSPFFANDLLIK